MLPLSMIKTQANELKIKSGSERQAQDLATAIHMMNIHRISDTVAIDQTSAGSHDFGIDGWFLDDNEEELYIYQSKMTSTVAHAQKGFDDLQIAHSFIEKIFLEGTIYLGALDNSIRSLQQVLLTCYQKVKTIHFVLVSASIQSELEQCKARENFISFISKNRLNRILLNRKGGIEVENGYFESKPKVARFFGNYSVDTFPETRLDLDNNRYMKVGYISLRSLVHLFQKRSNELFHKNVRLSLVNSKDGKLVAHPMEQTLLAICNGNLAPEMFTFYHLGITISATNETEIDQTSTKVEQPYVLNGCQTVTTAAKFYNNLVLLKNQIALKRFAEIKVLAKIIINMDTVELRDITNNSNRQNPIEPWQLFSNDDVHIRIELALKELGIFYERQKGKFNSSSSVAGDLEIFAQTNGHYISIIEFAQVIALMRGDWPRAAKPSDIFIDRANHDRIFDESIFKDIASAVICVNLFKACKRALKNSYSQISLLSDEVKAIDKPITRIQLWRLGMLYGLQKVHKKALDSPSIKLFKGAQPTLVNQILPFYKILVPKINEFYRGNMNGDKVDILAADRLKFFKKIKEENKLRDSDLPFHTN